MSNEPLWVVLKTSVDRPTAEKVRKLALESSPRRKTTEMVRHLIRLGLRSYEHQSQAGPPLQPFGEIRERQSPSA